ncbi:hypothetical protein CARUB_v10022223mg [Capsella rubella]|uniref:S-protein homolog n=1 Tax=Capsella rubella TaxID=81985 RepID=R0I980_9BRAS|nr:hypothetical protein CARUB_v10022223mg [Capsella rubella]
MKYSISCFLFVIVLSCVGLGDSKIWRKNGVHIKNFLRGVLAFVCVLNKEDLGYQYLNPGETYDFSFYDGVLPSKAYCGFCKGGEHMQESFHQHFRAYKGGGFLSHRGGKQNFWDVREDGFYFTHGRDTPKLEYTWLPF